MCDVAQFQSYDEAAEHESTCNQKPFSSNPALKSSPREVDAQGGAEEEPRPANKKPASNDGVSSPRKAEPVRDGAEEEPRPDKKKTATTGVSPGDSDKKRKAKPAAESAKAIKLHRTSGSTLENYFSKDAGSGSAVGKSAASSKPSTNKSNSNTSSGAR